MQSREAVSISASTAVIAAFAVVFGGIALALAPVAVLAVLLSRGVFVGEELIARGRRRLERRNRHSSTSPGRPPSAVRSLCGRLIALSLASRGPPAPA